VYEERGSYRSVSSPPTPSTYCSIDRCYRGRTLTHSKICRNYFRTLCSGSLAYLSMTSHAFTDVYRTRISFHVRVDHRTTLYHLKGLFRIIPYCELECAGKAKVVASPQRQILYMLHFTYSHQTTVTYKRLASLIIMGSGFDDWVHWDFTITVNYNGSHIDVCLTNLSRISD
jgi:hypothetical protein